MKIAGRFSIILGILCLVALTEPSHSQRIKWLRIGQLQSPVNEIGAEFEGEFSTGNINFFSWPVQYGIDQNTLHMKGVWIGSKNFHDPVENKLKHYKVVGSGSRDGSDRPNQIFPREITLLGRIAHPAVTVNGAPGSLLSLYDSTDIIDPALNADRVVRVRYNTSIGITVTKNVMAFDQPYHDNYFINDYVFTNTGIYDSAENVYPQTMDSVWFYFTDRYAFAGVGCTGYGLGWSPWSSTWGNSDIIHTFSQDPAIPGSTMRGFYTWPGPNRDRTNLTYDQDWGSPSTTTGVMASAKYAGCVTLHADKSVLDRTDDIAQPRTNNFISPDISIFNAGVSQYDETFMADRFAAIEDGYPAIQHDVIVGNDYPILWTDPRRQSGGGVQNEFAYGPYTLAPGDSIHIVFAEGVAGLSWDKNREVAGNWLQWYGLTGTPTLLLPNSGITTDYNLYKRRWVETSRDSLLTTYRNAIRNYNSGYGIPKAPPPPDHFSVLKGTNRIELSWSGNAESWPHFGGYVLYRSTGSVMTYQTVYEKIFDCGPTSAPHQFSDTAALPGVAYYYFIQTKDDGSQNDVRPGIPLTSSMFWTVTSVPVSYDRTEAGAYQSYQSGNWENPATWARFDGSAWVNPAPSAPTVADGTIIIQENHTVTAGVSVSVDQLTIKAGGSLTVAPAATLRIKSNGAGSNYVIVNGMLSNSGTVIIENGATLSLPVTAELLHANDITVVNAGSIITEGTGAFNIGIGTYVHSRNGGTIPTSNWLSGATCQIAGVTDSVPANIRQSFSNFIWDCPGQTADLSLGWTNRNYISSLKVKNTGWNRSSLTAPSFSLSLGNTNGACSIYSLEVSGLNAALALQTGAYSLTTDVNTLRISGGAVLLLSGTGGVSLLRCAGSFTVPDSGSIGTGNPSSSSTIMFTGDALLDIPSGRNTFFGGPDFYVNDFASLDLGSNVLSGSGDFTLGAHAILETSHPDGVNGNLQMSGTKLLSLAGEYIFDGTSPQFTGMALPDTAYNITVDNASNVMLSGNTFVEGNIIIKRGRLLKGTHTLSYGTSASLVYSGSDSRITSDDIFPASAGPVNLFVESGSLELHASRTIGGTLYLNGGKLVLGANTFTAASINQGSSASFAVTENGGVLRLSSLGTLTTKIPIGMNWGENPVWISNSGVIDTIGVGVVPDSSAVTSGGRVKLRWTVTEGVSGNGNYTMKFRWWPQQQDATFSAAASSAWKIYSATSGSESGSGSYTNSIGDRSLQRGGFTTVDSYIIATGAPVVDIEQTDGGLPKAFRLKQNYPNPFNPSTIISFDLPKDAAVTLKVYDVIGREVDTIVSEKLAAGSYTRQWDAANLAGGIYFYKLTAGNFTATRKLVLLK